VLALRCRAASNGVTDRPVGTGMVSFYFIFCGMWLSLTTLRKGGSLSCGSQPTRMLRFRPYANRVHTKFRRRYWCRLRFFNSFDFAVNPCDTGLQLPSIHSQIEEVFL